jgi:O-antigen/teichoic acid export membrane protein
MHVNLAVMNLIASTLLIPLFGLYGAGVGLTLTTAYNAAAEYKRYVERLGPIHGLRELATNLSPRVFVAGLLGLAALFVGYSVPDVGLMLGIELAILAGLAVAFLREPLTPRILGNMRRARVGRQ